VLLEAMRSGLCVAASDIEPVREAVEHGRTGRLFGVGDAAALRREIEWMLANPDAAAAIGRAARASLGQEHDWQRIAERTEAVYRSALVSGARGQG